MAPVAAQSTGMVMASNLGEAEAERDQRTQIGLDVGHAYAQSLTTGSTAVTLEKVRLYLRGRLGRPNPYRVARPFVTIRANSPVPGQPGRTLHVLTSPTIDSSIETYEDFTSDGYVLAANTTYWLVVHRPWGTDYFGFSATISEKLCRGRGTAYEADVNYIRTVVYVGPPEVTTPPENAFTGEPGWSLGDYFFRGIGSGWHESNCWSMRMGIYAGAQTGNQAANSPATGWPGIIGTVRAGETLTATTDYIEDEDGLTGAVFNYQWVRSGTDIEGATTSTYTMTDADEGKAIKVRVTFTDDAGNEESLPSNEVLASPPSTPPEPKTSLESTGKREAQGAQKAQEPAETPLTAAIHDKPESHNGQAAFKFELRFSEEFSLSYLTLRDDHVFTVEGGEVAGARRLVSGSNIRWEISVSPDSNGDVTVELPVTEDCEAQGAICTEDKRTLSSPLKFIVKGPPLTASFESVPTSRNGSGNFKFRIAFSEEFSLSYLTLRDDHVFTVEGGEVAGARRLVSGSNIRWEISVSPDSNGDVTVELPVTEDCEAAGGHLHRGQEDAFQLAGVHRQRARPVAGNKQATPTPMDAEASVPRATATGTGPRSRWGLLGHRLDSGRCSDRHPLLVTNAVKYRYDLAVDTAERAALRTSLTNCPDNIDIEAPPRATPKAALPTSTSPATATTTAPPTGGCHPAYEPCLPNLAGDALNCGDLTSAQRPVRVKQIGVDPYRLDRDQDGNACE